MPLQEKDLFRELGGISSSLKEIENRLNKMDNAQTVSSGERDEIRQRVVDLHGDVKILLPQVILANAGLLDKMAKLEPTVQTLVNLRLDERIIVLEEFKKRLMWTWSVVAFISALTVTIGTWVVDHIQQLFHIGKSP